MLIAAVLGAALTGALYLIASNRVHSVGFPLDDAWIHQTYARNLGEAGEWAFTTGTPSAGSTAPLWSALIALGYFAKLDPLAWTHLGGLLLLGFTAWLAARWYAARYPERAGAAWGLALMIPLEWHLAWAGLSGMETLALAGIAVLCFYWLESRRAGMLLVGLAIGVGLWIRPDALTLLVAPVGYLVLRDRERNWRTWLVLGVGVLVLLLPYVVFQRWLSGEIWPSTFFAKQAEYAALRELPLTTRLLTQIGVPGDWIGVDNLPSGGPLIGVLLVLLPGLILTVRYYVRRRRWSHLTPLFWCALYLALYAVRLPVTYQHGRYAIPVIPVLLVLSYEGMMRWVQTRSTVTWRRVVSRAWILVVAISSLSFWLLGAGAYARDVAIIESEMVATARWIRENTSEQATLAVHDIGAIGYFASRDLIDLAGLISPNVIPIIRNETALAEYLYSSGAEYLVTFPDWYPMLVENRSVVFTTQAKHSPAAGGTNMTVYAWGER